MLSTLFYSTLFTVSLASELVLYWGQASAGNQQSLGEYCKQTAGDIYVISFINNFNSQSMSLNVAGACSEQLGSSGLLHCPSIGADIKSCQAAGKKVFVSLGGAAGQYGFSGDGEGKLCAKNVWNTFGGGQSSERPFDDAVVDGFDLDIENGNDKGYTGFVEELRSYFSQSSKQFYISAAPQCPYPDASLGEALSSAHFDHVYVQFYNNYCSLAGNQFNWDTWQNYATKTSPNKNVKLFVGLPGSQSAAGSGYLGPDDIKNKIGSIQSSPNFGGVMLWDASQAFDNTENGVSFADSMHSILGGSSSGSNTGSSSSNTGSDSGSDSAAADSSAPATGNTRTTSSAPDAGSPATGSSSTQKVNNFAFEGSISVASSASDDSTITVTQPTTVLVGHGTAYSTLSSSTTAQPTSAAEPSSSAAAPSSIAAGAAVAPSPILSDIPDANCQDGKTRCQDSKYSICDHGKWVVFECAAGTVCSVNGEGYAYCVFPKREHHHHQVSGAFNVINV